MSMFRPLLAATIESDQDFDNLRFPMIASPKIDGIRVICHPTLGPVTRSLKPVRNKFILECLSDIQCSGLDGEITVGPINAKDMFHKTTSGVMTASGEPDFTYRVFDDCSYDEDPYNRRLVGAVARTRTLALKATLNLPLPLPLPRVVALEREQVSTAEEILQAEIRWLSEGYEGVMLRSLEGPYKFGRSTLREQTLLKLKRFVDDEATVIGFEELLRNQNTPTQNNLGLQERSTHKDGKVKGSTLGNLIVYHPTFGEFRIGSGFDSSLRDEIWNNQQKYLSQQVTFKYQKTGIKNLPRFPIMKGFRPHE